MDKAKPRNGRRHWNSIVSAGRRGINSILQFADQPLPVKAWRDWDYIEACANRSPDPFVFNTERTLDTWVLKAIRNTVPRHLRGKEYQDLESRNFGYRLDEHDAQVLGGVRTKRNAEAKLKGYVMRLTMAAIGGLFLIGPMLLMVLRNNRHTTLITTSVCVFVFSIVMASLLDQPFNVLSAMAAYVAVLVVFVGTKNS